MTYARVRQQNTAQSAALPSRTWIPALLDTCWVLRGAVNKRRAGRIARLARRDYRSSNRHTRCSHRDIPGINTGLVLAVAVIVVAAISVAISVDRFMDFTPVAVDVPAQVVHTPVKVMHPFPLVAVASLIVPGLKLVQEALITSHVRNIAVYVVAAVALPRVGTRGRRSRESH